MLNLNTTQINLPSKELNAKCIKDWHQRIKINENTTFFKSQF